MKPVQRKTIMMSILLSGVMDHTIYAHDHEDTTDQIDNSPRRQYNLKPSEFSENHAWAMGNSKKLGAPHLATYLPTKWDFSNQIVHIHSQGSLGSCSAQALTLSMELSLQKNNIQTTLSPLYVYYNERVFENSVNLDSGATLSDGVRAICTWGACKETTWSYDNYMTKFKIKPSDAAYAEGRTLLYLGAIVPNHVDYSLTSIKYILSQNIPIIFGVFIYPSFESGDVIRTGKVPMPSRYEQPLGGHALTFVGYNDETQEFKFANSWGKDWGDNGCGYISYQYVMNEGASGIRPYFFANDLWSISSRPISLNNTEDEAEDGPESKE